MRRDLYRDLYAHAAYVASVNRACRRQEQAGRGGTRDLLYALVRARRAWLRMLARQAA